MTEKRLDSANVVIGLKEMGGEAVAECMRSDPLGELGPPYRLIERFLHVLFMNMIAPVLFSPDHERQRLLREKPLPDKIFSGPRIFLFKLIVEKHAAVTGLEVFGMKSSYDFKLLQKLRTYRLRERHGPRFPPFTGLHSKDAFVEVEIMDAELDTFEEAKPADVK